MPPSSSVIKDHLLAHGVDPVLHVEGEEGAVQAPLPELWALAGEVLVEWLIVTHLGPGSIFCRKYRIK